MTFTQVQQEKARIRVLAEAAMARYPQYAGHFAEYKLVEVVNVKGLRARARRDWDPTPYVTIGKVDEMATLAGTERVALCWHIGREVDCALGLGNVRFLEE